ncbi:hypothetical protein [Brevibacillus sp. SIMBA_076]|uniref:hypothetical protein n=1 Tax=Brevibacillus sp. SIMBA_076 TaxID=3085814 RepID=UPI003979E9A3
MAIIVSAYCANEIPIHLNVVKGADITVNKYVGLFMLPVGMSGILLLHRLFNHVGIKVFYFLAALHVLLLYWALAFS